MYKRDGTNSYELASNSPKCQIVVNCSNSPITELSTLMSQNQNWKMLKSFTFSIHTCSRFNNKELQHWHIESYVVCQHISAFLPALDLEVSTCHCSHAVDDIFQ